MKPGTFTIVFIAIQIQPDYSQSLVLQPDSNAGKDSEIFSLQATTHYNSNTLRGNAYTFVGPFGIQRGLFEFNLSQVPSNATVTLARLSLFVPDSPHSQYQYGINDAIIQRITSTWSESTVTWSNQPSVTAVNEVSLAASTSSYQNYPNIIVTPLINDMLANPSTSFGFMLRLQVEQQYRRITFCGSRYPVAAKRPKLEIFYTTPVGTDGVTRTRAITFGPNPCSDILHINHENPGNEIGMNVQITNQLGQVLIRKPLSESEEIDLSGTPSQILTLQVTDPTNNIVQSAKLLKTPE